MISFRYEGYYSLVCEKTDLPSLEEVHFDNLEAPYTDEIEKNMPLNLMNMLNQLGNAKIVTLTFHTLEVLGLDSCVLEQRRSQFPNIKLIRKRGCLNYPVTMETVPERVMDYLTKGCVGGDSPVVKYSLKFVSLRSCI